MWKDAVELGIACFVGMRGATDEVLRERLASLGVEPWLAERLVTWLPVAYGRVLLKDVPFGDHYSAGDAQLRLSDDPVYVAARERAGRGTRDEMEAIALRSADVDAVNAYLRRCDEEGRTADLTSIRVHTALVDRLPELGTGDGGVAEPRDALRGFVEGHGFATLPDGMGIDAFVYPRVSADRFSLQVDYAVFDPRLAVSPLLESFGGVGATYRDAIGDTVKKLERGSVHVIIAGLLDQTSCEEQVEWETWPHPGGPIRVCLGGQLRLYGDGAPPMGPLLDRLRDALAGVALSPTIHALRVFTMRMGDRVYADEVLLDGQPWAEGLALVGAYAWPHVEHVWGTRLFALLDARR
ncbi:MAG: hypothetical protein KC619_01590 [Myxococcales bacterium]|nr:hypothetical protein [Myxococcales bacterium]